MERTNDLATKLLLTAIGAALWGLLIRLCVTPVAYAQPPQSPNGYAAITQMNNTSSDVVVVAGGRIYYYQVAGANVRLLTTKVLGQK